MYRIWEQKQKNREIGFYQQTSIGNHFKWWVLLALHSLFGSESKGTIVLCNTQCGDAFLSKNIGVMFGLFFLESFLGMEIVYGNRNRFCDPLYFFAPVDVECHSSRCLCIHNTKRKHAMLEQTATIRAKPKWTAV